MFPMIINQAKKHPNLIPLFMFIGAGGGVEGGATLYVLGLVNLDVGWDRKNNPEPWNKMNPTDQYQFHSVNVDLNRHPNILLLKLWISLTTLVGQK
uniref:Cytochrome c oxidase subunit NDUFA4 n=1 Tax=Vombatus ursinus TaxID=29139 RepID=A0A4X2KZV3_VOMUR